MIKLYEVGVIDLGEVGRNRNWYQTLMFLTNMFKDLLLFHMYLRILSEINIVVH